MSYIKRTIYAGDEIYVTKINAPMFGNHNSRSERVKPTAPAVKKCSDFRAAELCEAKLKLNFRPHDWHIALTYSCPPEEQTDERCSKDLRNFLDKLKRRCIKNGITLKYLKMTEKGVRSHKIHHHLVLPQEISISMMYECWSFGQIRILNTLYANGDFKGLAEYFVDKTKGGQKDDDRKKGEHRFTFSRNCKEPKITYELIHFSRWNKPAAPKGYIVKQDSIRTGTTSAGFPYQRYTLIRAPRSLRGHENVMRKNC